MIEHTQQGLKLPITGSILKNAQLRYVNLEQLISDSKSSRASKHDAFLSCAYHDSIDLLLIHKGEIVNALRFEDSRRSFISINEALARAQKVKLGILNYEKTEIDVHYLILATLYFRPQLRNLNGNSIKYKDLLKVLFAKKWSGFIEFGLPHELNFMTISEGQPRKTYLNESLLKKHGPKIVPQLGTIMAAQSYYCAAYKIESSRPLFSQVSPSHIALFAQLFLDIFHALQDQLGKSGTLEFFLSAREEIIAENLLMFRLTIDLNGKLIYNGIAEARTFTSTLSAWLQATMTKMIATTRCNVVTIVRNVLQPHDLTLRALGFYSNCPLLH
ncbi:hypothetical protein JXQ70_01185 [bacterium]|nr:hypothetical protein [bacterium]